MKLHWHIINILYYGSFPSGSVGKESAYNPRDLGSIPRLGRSPRKENGNPLQFSCLENSMDRGARQATAHGIIKSQTWLCDFHFHFHFDVVKVCLVLQATTKLSSMVTEQFCIPTNS